MGEVFRARDDRIGREVAIKVLPASFAADAGRLQRFEQEARTAGGLHHPNLITIYDIGRDNGAPYIVMELLDGETLRDRLSSARADRKKTLLAIADAADAIAAAHHAGVIHRDLKPENIIVTTSGYTKVLDFGLAKFEVKASAETATQVRKTEPGVVMGTAGYMSPEQAQGRPADARSDIFALGCILYETLTGKRAFEGKSTVETLNNIINTEPALVRTIDPRLPAEMQRIVRKCLAKDPDHRYQSAKDLAIDLRDGVAEFDSGASVTVQAAKRNWSLEIIAGLLLAAIAGALGWYAATHRRTVVASALSIRPMTTSGDVIEAAVSPDGKYIAFVTSRKGQHSLWLRQIGTTQSIPVIAPAGGAFWGHAFTPDGTSIDYGFRSAGTGGALYQIATLGGQPRQLVKNVDSAVTFSPDGKKIAFTRASFPKVGSSAVMVANADGSDAHPLVVKSGAEQFAPLFFGGPAWSPDGRTIVVAVNQIFGAERGRLSAFDAQTGAETPLTKAEWSRAAKAVWLPDGKALIVVATAPHALVSHLWRVEYPSGEAHQITSGTADYRDPSITADGRSLAAVAATSVSTLNVYSGGLNAPPRHIGNSQNDGTFGVEIAADGSVIYTCDTPNGMQLWTCDAAGACQQIVTSTEINRDPVAAPDGRIVFYGAGSRGVGLWRVRKDGSDLAMIAATSNVSVPFLSPDGKTLYFNSESGDGPHLYRVSIDGGKPQLATPVMMGTASISPDGKWFAGYAIVDGRYRFALVDVATGAIGKTFDLRGSNYTRFRWSADGKMLYYNANSQLHGFELASGQTHPVLVFEPPVAVNGFAIAKDGTFIVSHGPYTRDAYLITGFD